MGWRNPHEWVIPQWLKMPFRSLENFLDYPQFDRGVKIGTGKDPVYDSFEQYTVPGQGTFSTLKVNDSGSDTLEVRNFDDSAYIDIKALSFIVSSSRELKEDIEPLQENDKFSDLKPVQFTRVGGTKNPNAATEMNENTPYIGLVAEEVAELYPYAVRWELGEEGDPVPTGIDYTALVAILIQRVQALEATAPGNGQDK